MSTLTSVNLNVKRSSTRVHAPPGGVSNLSFGDYSNLQNPSTIENLSWSNSKDPPRTAMNDMSLLDPYHSNNISRNSSSPPNQLDYCGSTTRIPTQSTPTPKTPMIPPLTSSIRDQVWEKKRLAWLKRKKMSSNSIGATPSSHSKFSVKMINPAQEPLGPPSPLSQLMHSVGSNSRPNSQDDFASMSERSHMNDMNSSFGQTGMDYNRGLEGIKYSQYDSNHYRGNNSYDINNGAGYQTQSKNHPYSSQTTLRSGGGYSSDGFHGNSIPPSTSESYKDRGEFCDSERNVFQQSVANHYSLERQHLVPSRNPPSTSVSSTSSSSSSRYIRQPPGGHSNWSLG